MNRHVKGRIDCFVEMFSIDGRSGVSCRFSAFAAVHVGGLIRGLLLFAVTEEGLTCILARAAAVWGNRS
jgi:membrane associated rhomboid family serine protease